jgi:hypothetical protein
MRTVSSLGGCILTAALLTFSAHPLAVHAKAQELSDDELDAVTAGTDFCQFAVTNGICTPSLFQFLNPQSGLPGQQPVLPSSAGGFLLSMQQLINPQSETLTQVVVAPLPATGTVTVSLRASASSPDGSRSQIAISTNSASTGGNGNGSTPFRGTVDLSPTALLLRTTPVVHP